MTRAAAQIDDLVKSRVNIVNSREKIRLNLGLILRHGLTLNAKV